MGEATTAARLATDALVAVAGQSTPAPPELEFLGLSATDCPVDCTPGRCVISGSVVFRNEDGTKTITASCGHPFKGALAPIQQVNSEIVRRHGRAKKYLLMEVARRRADRGDPQ